MKKILVIVAFLGGMTISSSCWASPDSYSLENLPRRFVIRQETFQNNGVYVCRPVPIDKKIMDLLSNNNIHSLNDYMKWVADNIDYFKDKNGDEWLSPEETLIRKQGDCEDYAFLNEAVLRVFGYKPEIIAMQGANGGHAICIFKDRDMYCWIDNSVLKKTKARSLSELQKHLFSVYGYKRVFSLSSHKKNSGKLSNLSDNFFQ